jgi:dTDP-4-dehydrorhamnose reductase
VSSPSYGPDVARLAVELAEARASGLIHVAGPEVIDRVRFARALADGLGFDASLIEGKSTAEFGQPARRPLNGGLLTPRLDARQPGAMRPLAEALEDFKARLVEPGSWVRPLP